MSSFRPAPGCKRSEFPDGGVHEACPCPNEPYFIMAGPVLHIPHSARVVPADERALTYGRTDCSAAFAALSNSASRNAFVPRSPEATSRAHSTYFLRLFTVQSFGGLAVIARRLLVLSGLDGIKNKLDPGPAMDKDLYDLPPKELKKIPTVCGSLRDADEPRQGPRVPQGRRRVRRRLHRQLHRAEDDRGDPLRAHPASGLPAWVFALTA